MTAPALALPLPLDDPLSCPPEMASASPRPVATPAAGGIARTALQAGLCQIPEPRSPQGRRYPLPVLLGVLLVGLCCGCHAT